MASNLPLTNTFRSIHCFKCAGKNNTTINKYHKLRKGYPSSCKNAIFHNVSALHDGTKFLLNYYKLLLLSCRILTRTISQFGVSKNTCARRDKKKHIFFFFCHAKYTHEFALKKYCISKICLILSRRAHVFFETPN